MNFSITSALCTLRIGSCVVYQYVLCTWSVCIRTVINVYGTCVIEYCWQRVGKRNFVLVKVR